MSEFQELTDELNAALAEQDALAKAMRQAPTHPEPDDDNRGGPSDEDRDNEYDPEEEEEEEEDDGKPFGKSFAVTMGDGSTVEALDGTEVIAALQADTGRQFEEMAKSLRQVVGLVKAQTATIGDLRQQVADLGRRPAGRKSVLNVHEKPDALAGVSGAPTVTPAAVLTKALAAQRAGALHAGQVAEIESYLGAGKPLPDYLARALA